jgi:HYDIN/CFA65/VesB-like, Ig-like domain/Protein of unknown function (DUF1573)/Beta-propeller repeat/Abnormal spindle-like microcephaly-assoc'd, ASPM-SPD-2-Hydin
MRFSSLLPLQLVVAAVLSSVSSAQSIPSQANASQTYGKLPLTFEANQGQTNGQVKFLSRGSNYSVFLTSQSMVLALAPSSNSQPTTATPTVAAHTASPVSAKQAAPASQKPKTVSFTLVGASSNATPVGENLQPGKANYFIGSDHSKWRTNIPTYARVRYKNVYPGIDLVYYGNQRQVEYDFVVAAGADPSQIKFNVTGADTLAIDESGDLALKVGNGQLKFKAPAIYQETGSQRSAISGSYRVNGNQQVVFDVDKHDSSKPLVIDPVLVYSTYVGGRSDDEVSDMGIDSIGNLYLNGYTTSPDFPLAVDNVPNTNSQPIFVAKLDVSGSTLLYADYIAGSYYDSPHSMKVTADGTVYLEGQTSSQDFPTVHPYQATLSGNQDVFVSELSPDGATLVYSTYLGGSTYQSPNGIALGPNGEILVTGTTQSSDFPVANAIQSTLPPSPPTVGQVVAGFVTEFSADGSTLNYSTYLTGTQFIGAAYCEFCQMSTSPQAIAADSSGNAYLVGSTNSSNYPTTDNAFITTFPFSANTGSTASFVTKLNSSGQLSYSTFFGVPGSTTGYIQPNAMALDAEGEVYLLGYYDSSQTFPIVAAGVCNEQNAALCRTAFLTKFAADGKSVVFSTLLPVFQNANLQLIALDGNENIFLGGTDYAQPTGTDPGLINPIEEANGAGDILLAELDPGAANQSFLTFFGGVQGDGLDAMVLDSSGALYIAGVTSSADLPVTEAGYQQTNGGSADAFAAKIDMNTAAPAVAIAPSLLQYSIRDVGTSGQQKSVILRNMGTAPLLISSAVISGDFTQTNTCGSSVPAGGTCTFEVTFTPTAPGSRFGTILIQDNAVGSPHFINLSGVGSTPVVELSATSLTFDSLQVNATSAAQTISLTNQGNATLILSSIAASGDFTETNNCPPSVALGASCQIQVKFKPTAGGTRTGAITFTDNAGDSPEIVSLTGSGYTTTAAVSPSSLQFNATQASATAAVQIISVTNTGANTLQMYGVTVTGNFTQTNNCGTLAPNASCSINVTFTPKSSGTLTGSISLNDNAAGNPQTIALTGTGVAPVVTLSAPSLTFANQNAGSAVAQKLTITNTGNAVLNFSSIQVQGSFSQTNNCTAVAPSASCTVNVAFNPNASGATTGSITFIDGAVNSPQVVALNGTGQAPQITLSPTSLQYPGAPIGTPSAGQAVTVTNSGTAAMTISGIQATGDFAQTNTCGASLAPSATCTVMVTFNPQAAGARTGTLTLAGNTQNSGVALSGSGADFSLTASDATTSATAGSSATFTVNVASVGAPFSSPVALSCSGVPVGSTCTVSQASVTPGGSPVPVTVTVTSVAASSNAALPAGGSDLGLWWLRVHGVSAAVLLVFFRRGRKHRGLWLAVIAPLIVGTLMVAGCGGSGHKTTPAATGGTPAGTYQLTVLGTAGTSQHSIGLTLKLQ